LLPRAHPYLHDQRPDDPAAHGRQYDRGGPYVEELGFCKPKVASHYWRWSYQNDIRCIHRRDPEARFVLVGYSIGGSVVLSMARALEKDSIFIDLLVYIDAHSFIHSFKTRPANVGKIVSINSTGWFLPGKCHPGEECHSVDTFFHLAIPHQEKTLHTLARELTELATTCCGVRATGSAPPEQGGPALPTVTVPGQAAGVGSSLRDE
jgi:hypothetical protein